jgi:hypothetical protein
MTSTYAGPDNPPDLDSLTNISTDEDLDLSASLSLNYFDDLPKSNILNHVYLNDWSHVPGAYRLKFVGIHDMVLGQVQRRLSKQLRDDLRIEYTRSNMQESEFRQRMEAISSEYNPYGNWWERSWMHSLPPEQGGAPKVPVVNEIGWEISLENAPIVGWFKKQFDKLGDMWISVDHEFDEESGPNPNRRDGKTTDEGDFNQLKVRKANLGIDQDYRWFESSFYHVRFKPTLRLTSSNTSDYGFVEEIAVRVQVDLFVRDKTNHFATVNFFVSHDLEEENTYFSVFLEFVNF